MIRLALQNAASNIFVNTSVATRLSPEMLFRPIFFFGSFPRCFYIWFVYYIIILIQIWILPVR